eukprot:GHVL01012032.1.p1 GENE.GHVL01012032.1~~GHVL01012032.1.p1  ORF type:complete len:444 (-),score=157.97 GHVL01012032.1:901-2232(-)
MYRQKRLVNKSTDLVIGKYFNKYSDKKQSVYEGNDDSFYNTLLSIDDERYRGDSIIKRQKSRIFSKKNPIIRDLIIENSKKNIQKKKYIQKVRILDIDKIPVKELNSNICYILTRNLPAEKCMHLVSRLALFRDKQNKDSYNELMNIISNNCGKYNPIILSYFVRGYQTICIPYIIDYIRRYGQFSREYIVKGIEKCSDNELFDFIRYNDNNRQIPSYILYPWELQSYTRLLKKSSIKSILHEHLTINKHIPIKYITNDYDPLLNDNDKFDNNITNKYYKNIDNIKRPQILDEINIPNEMLNDVTADKTDDVTANVTANETADETAEDILIGEDIIKEDIGKKGIFDDGFTNIQFQRVSIPSYIKPKKDNKNSLIDPRGVKKQFNENDNYSDFKRLSVDENIKYKFWKSNSKRFFIYKNIAYRRKIGEGWKIDENYRVFKKRR